jgi:hypothetical protein
LTGAKTVGPSLILVVELHKKGRRRDYWRRRASELAPRGNGIARSCLPTEAARAIAEFACLKFALLLKSINCFHWLEVQQFQNR